MFFLNTCHQCNSNGKRYIYIYNTRSESQTGFLSHTKRKHGFLGPASMVFAMATLLSLAAKALLSDGQMLGFESYGFTHVSLQVFGHSKTCIRISLYIGYTLLYLYLV